MKTATTVDDRLAAILDYISSAWDALTRSTSTCEGVGDSKLLSPPVLYLPADFPVPPELHKRSAQEGVRILHLPAAIQKPGQTDGDELQPPGLLFLPNPYVVPGGRFNEMYGWDSYFIIRGLLAQGRVELARGMVENFFFEIEHYGAILNANRTYYLSRSQPPFLSSMVLALYEAGAAGQTGSAWLARAHRYIAKDYSLWTRKPHLAGNTGLSRYFDLGEGPVPEGLHDEAGYYRDVIVYFLNHDQESSHLAKVQNHTGPAPRYSLQVCQENGSSLSSTDLKLVHHLDLRSEFYKGDRSMRESGFDISFRFGPFGAETHHYAPVCLNSLLYKTELDMAQISTLLGHKAEAGRWHQRARKRQNIMRRLMWDRRRGLFFDYHFLQKARSSYEYATTFYPLWVGLATKPQARQIINNLPWFEEPGGLAMSRQQTGAQWDYPYGWAPIQLLAVEGLRRYGDQTAANRISCEFLNMLVKNFEHDHNLREKYNVVTDSSRIRIGEGYHTNVVGFGWTNGVFLELLNQLPPRWKQRLRKQSAAPDPAV